MSVRHGITALAAALILLPVPSLAAALQEASRVTSVKASAEEGRTVLLIEVSSAPINYSAYSKDATTLMIDLYGVEAEGMAPVTAVNSAEVADVKLEFLPAKSGYSSIVRFQLAKKSRLATHTEAKGKTLRVVVDGSGSGRPVRSLTPVNPKLAEPLAIVPAVEDAAPTPSLEVPAPATRLSTVKADASDGSLTVTMDGNGSFDYEIFPLDKPARLVLDLKGVTSDVRQRLIPVASRGVRQLRVAQFQTTPTPVARVVFDLDESQPYKVVTSPDGSVHVRFGELQWEPAIAAGIASLRQPTDGAAAQAETPAAARELAQPSALAAGDAGSSAGSDSGAYEAHVHGGEQDEEGTLVSLDLKDADIKDVLRYFSEISGLNLILDPGVSGTVTVKLIDVPWNKALDIILKAYGYGRALEGNVMRIASVDKLTSEEKASSKLREEQILNRPLVTITRPVSYASADDIATVLKATALSERGTIIIDKRTQTLVIQEVGLPEYQQRIIALIDQLDQPTPQVEIEARIVETNRTYVKSFGIQWGFNATADQTTGSTTDFKFPNSYKIKGDRVASSAGFNSSLPGGGYAVNLPGAGANSGIGLQFGNIMNTFGLDIMLSALENDGAARLLSTPKITTQNNVAATIESGTQIPVQTVANNTITVQFVSASLRLIVTPQITADKTVSMKLTVEQNEPDQASAIGPGAVPAITTRRAETQVLVADGGTAVIGGVFKQTDINTQSRLPGIYKLPGLGWLFKNKNSSRTNNELLIFITPKIKKLVR